MALTRTNLELISQTPDVLTFAPPSKPKRSIVPIVISVLAPVLAVGWGVLGSTFFSRGLAQVDDQQLVRAERAWNAAVESAFVALNDEARVLVDDARIREPMAVPNVDDETLIDLLQELKLASRASLVGIVNPAGVVRVVAGADAVRGVDLSGSSLMKPAEGKAPATTWVFPDRIVAVTVAPIRLGERFSGYLMMGRDIGGTLGLVEQATGVSGAVVFQQKVVVSTDKDASHAASFIEAASLEQGHSATVSGNYLARATRVDANKSGSVAWIVPQLHAGAVFGIHQGFWWSPAIFVALGTLLFWGLEYRRRSVGGSV